MLEASNLGQVLGRMQYGESELQPPIAAAPALLHATLAAQAAAVPAAPAEDPAPKATRNGLTHRIRDELAACSSGCGLTVPQLTARLECVASELTGRLAQMKDVQRTGEHGHYVYRLKRAG